MIFDTTPANWDAVVERRVKEHRERGEKELRAALRYYYIWRAQGWTGGDIENLVQQGVDAADAVLAGYPPLQEKRTLAAE
jgi:hypothetical protein